VSTPQATADRPTSVVVEPVRAGRADARPARRRPGSRRRLELVMLLGPALVLFVGFVLLPIGVAAYYSLHDWNGFGPVTDFVGLHNYGRALSDDVFQHAILHNLTIASLSLVVQLPLSIALALLLNRRLRGRAFLRLVVFAPYVLSEAITAVIWLLMLQPDGFVDHVMKAVGLGGLVQEWLANGSVVLYSLFVVITWKYIGFGIILLLAGLQGIPSELREAALCDGATAWQATRRVTLPLLAPTIRIWIFLSIIGSLQLFDLVYIIWGQYVAATAGTSTMATYMVVEGRNAGNFGYGNAVAVVLFVISLIIALVYQRFVLRRDTEGALTEGR
jgi:raffinose/stachyose/melibiose transport system permease protein